MAGKAHRVASRQGQLSRKRKKPQRGAADPVSDVRNPAEVAGNGDGINTPRTLEETPPPVAPAPSTKRSRAPVMADQPSKGPRAPSRTRGERPAAYNYTGSELRRILSFVTVVLIIIMVLGVLL